MYIGKKESSAGPSLFKSSGWKRRLSLRIDEHFETFELFLRMKEAHEASHTLDLVGVSVHEVLVEMLYEINGADQGNWGYNELRLTLCIQTPDCRCIFKDHMNVSKEAAGCEL